MTAAFALSLFFTAPLAEDVAADVAADVPAVDVPADVPAVDVPADVPADVASDVPADVPADVASDVPADEPDRRGWSAYAEGLTYAPVWRGSVDTLNFAILPTSQSWFDSYTPVVGDESHAGGLWFGYQGAGIAGLLTMGGALAGNRLLGFPNNRDLGGPLAAGGFNDQSPLSVAAANLGLYGRVGSVALAVGGAGGLESVVVNDSAAKPDFDFGVGLGGAAELSVNLWEDANLALRTQLLRTSPLSNFDDGVTKLDPVLALTFPVFGATMIVGVGAAVVWGDGAPLVAPRLIVGGGGGGDGDAAAVDGDAVNVDAASVDGDAHNVDAVSVDGPPGG